MLYVSTHSPEEIAAVIAPQFPDTNAETLSSIISRYKKQDTWKSDLIFSADSYDLLLTILSDAGELSEKPDYRVLVRTDFAEEAASSMK